MKHNELRQLLDQLRNDLTQAPGLDDTSRLHMHSLLTEIERGVGEPTVETHRTLRDRLVEAMTAFEAQHPRLTATLSRLADQLAAMGI